MKKIILFALMLLYSIISFAQNNDPYKVFGHDSKVEYKTTIDELLYIKNADTSSPTKAIAFDIKNGFVILIGANNKVLRMDSIGYEKIMRFISSDPMTHARVEWSPYNFCRNNPIRNVDPTGGLDHPIYDQEGSLLGTDDQGLQGQAIVMNKANFQQGMKHEDALKNNLGVAGLKDDKAASNLLSSYKSLPGRPDYDGKLTLSEANEWYRTSGGKPLYVDLGQIDFSTTHKSDVSFNPDGKTGYVNLFLTQSPLSEMMDGGGNVYGSIKIQVTNNLLVTAPKDYHDVYDFDQKPWGINPMRWMRNIGTKIGEWNAGAGTPYDIYFYGSNQLTIPYPPR